MAYTTIDNPELYFQVKTYTGTGSSNALTLDGDENMQPDYVMIKQRSSTQQWNGYDDLRGVQKYLGWNTDILENTQTQGLTAFGSDGFTVGTDDMVNKSSSTYVAYCWKEASGIFDMVLYTGNGSNRTISHSLSATPDLVITKRRDNTGNWMVGGSTTLGGDNKLLLLDTTATLDDNSEVYQSFSSSTFGIGVNAYINTNTSTYISYLFSSKQGYSKISSFVGNGSTDGTFVYTGFRPAFVMCKRTDSTGSWYICDIKRVGYNGRPNNSATVGNPELAAQSNRSEAGGNTNVMDIFSNGFKLIQSGAEINASGGTFIFMAFAESSFVNSKGVPCNAR